MKKETSSQVVNNNSILQGYYNLRIEPIVKKNISDIEKVRALLELDEEIYQTQRKHRPNSINLQHYTSKIFGLICSFMGESNASKVYMERAEDRMNELDPFYGLF